MNSVSPERSGAREGAVQERFWLAPNHGCGKAKQRSEGGSADRNQRGRLTQVVAGRRVETDGVLRNGRSRAERLLESGGRVLKLLKEEGFSRGTGEGARAPTPLVRGRRSTDQKRYALTDR